ncbi:MAG: MBL fold metallo-hydrolase [Gemmatimonadaceae bacterium]
MNLRVFQSDEGDCLLLTSADDRHVLCDGGMAASYTDHVAAHLAALRDGGEALDVVYVSHIDEDHISGVLEMMDDAVAWRVHDYQKGSGNSKHKEPTVARPPEVRAIWHNAFHEQVGKNAGPIEDMLAASAAVLSGHELPKVRAVAEAQRNLATSTLQAVKLTRRVGEGQLNIPVNGPADGQLMLVRDSRKPIKVGALRFHIIGPFVDDLANLRKEWNDWLRENKDALERVRDAARRDEDRLAAAEVERVIGSLLAQARVFGDRGQVTTPNLASLMFYVEEQGTGARVLLTGDGHAKDVLAGLEHNRTLDADGGIHVDVLKVQHHGSEYNMTREFARRVTADHYVFCANGAHENPDLETIEVLIASRLGGRDARSARPEAERPFTFWFNSHASVAGGKAGSPEHMRKVEALVSERAKKSRGKMKAQFLKRSSFALDVP